MNFPIQNLVADAMSLSLGNLYRYRRQHSLDGVFSMRMQIHDAVIMSVPISHARQVVDEILPECMVRQVPLFATDLDGRIIDNTPKYLSIGINVCQRWGEALTPAQCKQFELPTPYTEELQYFYNP